MPYFTKEQIMAQIEAALAERPQEKVLVFACNWCSYAGADQAGIEKIQYPPSARIIRTMCSARVEEDFIARAFQLGAGAVLVTGCRLTRQVPRGLSRVLWDIQFDGNPWGSPPSHRSAWARGLDVPQFSATDHQVLYYVGCTVAYDRRAQRVARALVSLFRAAAVPFGILGDDEPCCGHAARDLGQLEYARHLAQQGAEIFRRAGVRTLVATSPHCYDMFSRHYPPVSDSFRPLHYTSFLAQLVEEGRLCFRPLPWRVTFHDPCYLGRRHGVVEEPRRILRAIPQLELKEMAHTGPKTLCCGGGGGRMWLETEAHARLSHLRVEEAAATGAQVLVTACPHCIA
jgi:Fe-S oxidoreductase